MESTTYDEQLRKVAEICIIGERPLHHAQRELDLPLSRISYLKTSHAAHEMACDILLEKSAAILKRIKRKEIKEAARLFVLKQLTTSEIDDELELKPGTTKLLSAHRVWKLEKKRAEKEKRNASD